MDYVDLYIYHMWDYQTPVYDIMEGLNNIVKAGKVRYIGISNCFAWQACESEHTGRKTWSIHDRNFSCVAFVKGGGSGSWGNQAGFGQVFA